MTKTAPSSSTPPDFTGECSECAALCCLALAFDEGPSFAHPKLAGQPCHNLAGHGCSIHSKLSSSGYTGCVAYDCLGAGQRASALFTQSWKDRPELIGPMMQAFRTMRDIQELRQLLYAAHAFPLPDQIRVEMLAWHAVLDPPAWDEDALETFATQNTAAKIKTWLRSLADHIQR